MIYFKKFFTYKNHFKVRKKAIKITTYTFLIFLVFVWIIPFLLMVNYSFKDYAQTITKTIFDLPDPYTLNNYAIAYNALDFWSSLFITLLITISSNITIIFGSSLIAWQLARCKKWWSNLIFYTFLITLIIPFQAVMLPLITLIGKMNLLNVGGLIFMYTGFGMSLSVFMMHGFLSGIPTALEEAAMVEGLNPIQIYLKVILPLLKPIIITIVILNTAWIWNDFLLPFLVYINDRNQSTTLIVRLYNDLVGTYGSDLIALMAGLTILIIPIVVFYISLQKNIISGMTGAVK